MKASRSRKLAFDQLFDRLCRSCGEEKAMNFVDSVAGMRVYFPKEYLRGTQNESRVKFKKVIRLMKSAVGQVELAHILDEYRGIIVRFPKRNSYRYGGKGARDLAVWSMYRREHAIFEVATRFNLTEGHVRSILREMEDRS